MPPLERTSMTQRAVVWRATGQNDNYGQPLVGTAEEIRVRWVDKRTETKDARGNSVMLDATVTVSSHQVIPIGSNMWLGRLSEIPGTSFRTEDEGLMQVVTSNRTPDIKGRLKLRVLGLKRFRDILPS